MLVSGMVFETTWDVEWWNEHWGAMKNVDIGKDRLYHEIMYVVNSYWKRSDKIL